MQRPSQGPRLYRVGEEQDAFRKYIHGDHNATVASKREGPHTVHECTPAFARAQPPRQYLSCTSTCSGTFKATQICS